MLLIGRLISNHVGDAGCPGGVFYHAGGFPAAVGEIDVVAFIAKAIDLAAVVLEKILYPVGTVVIGTGI
ncbi:hypothetical protein NT017_12270 [Prolixibacter sp. NT017]|nr:hypothetical protein NT017_12270 [Prolixibacter sp. NT017]